MNVEKYRSLFVHRSDVYAEQQSSGAYLPKREPLDDYAISEHLAGVASYGVYVIDPAQEQSVHYVVFDLDTYDADALDFLCRAVERLVATACLKWWPQGTTGAGEDFRHCLMLEDSGGKGYHLWLFLSEPLPAAQVRAWAEPVRKAYDAARYVELEEPSRVIEWPALEIFPKQDAVPEGGYGNLVKLPFGRHAKTCAQSLPVLREGWAFTLDDVVPFDINLIPERAEPARRATEGRTAPGDAAGGVHGRTPLACVNRILDEGAPAGTRDNAMLHFAHYARGVGLPEDLVSEWCERVNEEFDPPLTQREVRTKVSSVFRMQNEYPSCAKDWLRDFCPGSDRKPSCPNFNGAGGDAIDDDDAMLSAEERRSLRLQRGKDAGTVA